MDRQRTLAILCGAEAWRKLPQFQAADAFARTAGIVRKYLTAEDGLGLDPANVLDLFNGKGAVKHYRQISKFLAERTASLDARRGQGVLVVFWYIGHGAFFGPNRDYCLLLADTEGPYEAETSLRMSTLAGVLRDKASQSARLLILDCCFAGVAFESFQGSLEQAVGAKASEVLEADKSVALLCAASARNPARLQDSTSTTLFGGALMDVFRRGDPSAGELMSVREVCRLVNLWLAESGVDDPPRPEVHCPDQAGVDLASVPLFPNPARNSTRDVAEAVGDFRQTPGAETLQAVLRLEKTYSTEVLAEALDALLDQLATMLTDADRVSYFPAIVSLNRLFEEAQDRQALLPQLDRYARLLTGSPTFSGERSLLVGTVHAMDLDASTVMRLCHTLAPGENDYNFRENDWQRLAALVTDDGSIASLVNDAIVADPRHSYEALAEWLADERGLRSSHDPPEAQVADIASGLMCHTARIAPEALFDVLARSPDRSERTLRALSWREPELTLRQCRRWVETHDAPQIRIAVQCAASALVMAKDPDTRDALLALVRAVYDSDVPGSGRHMALLVLLSHPESVMEVIGEALAEFRQGKGGLNLNSFGAAIRTASDTVLPDLLAAVDSHPKLIEDLLRLVRGVRLNPELEDALVHRADAAYRDGTIQDWELELFATDAARGDAARRHLAFLGIATDAVD
jgi:hypothetical protein